MTERVFDGLFHALRESCDAAVWSKGVEITRSSRVFLEADETDELVLLVESKEVLQRSGRRKTESRRVRLFPADEDWMCDCDGDDPCAHAAAAAIAYRQAGRRGVPLLRRLGGKPGHIGYRLSRTPQGLSLQRVIVRGGDEHPLPTTLAAAEHGLEGVPSVEATRADKRAEAVLGGHVGGVLPRHTMTLLLDELSHCPDVRLDGEPITASRTRSIPFGRVDDHPEGFHVFIEQDPEIIEVFGNGVVLLGSGVLKAVGEAPLDAQEIQELRRGRVYRREDVTRLVTEVIPSLSERLPFEVRSNRLPRKAGRAPVRVLMETSREGDALSVLPLLVYGDPPIARVDSGKLVPLGKDLPVRDSGAERALTRRLQAVLGLEPGRRTQRRGAQALALADALERWGEGEVQGSGHEQFFRAPPLVPKIHVDGDDLDMSFVAEAFGEGEERKSGGGPAAGGRRAGSRAVIEAWRSGESMIALEGGGVSALPVDWLRRFGEQVSDLLAAREVAGGKTPKACLPDMARLCASLEEPPPPGFEKLRDLVALSSRDGAGQESFFLPEPDLPADLSATLRPYQRVGVSWLSFLREAGLGALLADDMGLGKTLQALCALKGPSLVVAPASVLHAWADEAARFRPGLCVSTYHGPGRRLDPSAELTLTTYAILRIDANELASREWGTVILDEAQAIKNPESQAARAAFRLRGEFRIALTGTPVENRLDELWSQVHFTNPGLLGGRSDFQSRYSRPIGDGDAEVAARMRARIKPFVLRRTKAAVAPELPARTDTILRCTLGDHEQRVYDAVRAAARQEIAERLSAGGGVMEALEALLRMRQAACHPSLVPGQEAASSAKIDLLMETLEEALSGGHKALVFSQWTGLLDLVEPKLEDAGIVFSRLDGSTRDRAGVVRGFQRDDGPPVMLVSLKAGGTGLTLTAADHVFLLDPWWNPAVEEQAAGRAHRIGQTRPVIVHKLVAESTVEEKIIELQAYKRTLFDAALDEARAGSGLTREDLLSLVE